MTDRRKYYISMYCQINGIIISVVFVAFLWVFYYVYMRDIPDKLALIVFIALSVYMIFFDVMAVLLRLFGSPLQATVLDDKVHRGNKGKRIHKLYLECEDEEGRFVTTYKYTAKFSPAYPMGFCPYDIGDNVEMVKLWFFITTRDEIRKG